MKGMTTEATSAPASASASNAQPVEPRAEQPDVAVTWSKRDLQHTSALVMVPPPHTWPPVQAIRSERDKSYLRWMPHVNLLYPFLRDDAEGRNFGNAAEIAEAALAGVSPFKCSLASFAYFKHARSCTVWLHPSDPIGALPDDDAASASTSAAAAAAATAAAANNNNNEDDDNDADPGAKAATAAHRAPGTPATPPASPGLMRVQAALQAAFPFADDLSTISPAGFTPHLSVGQW